MKEFKYVFVPCDVDAPIEELTMQYSSSTEVNCCTEKFKKHFQSATKSMSSEQKTQFLAEVMKNAQKDHKNFDPQNVSEEMLNSLTSMQMVDIVSLSTPKKASGFVSVNMYVDDSGSFKQLPPNRRASALAAHCGKAVSVLGDAFITRLVDDGMDLFQRQDFLASEFSPDAPWITEAVRSNTNSQPSSTSGASIKAAPPKVSRPSEQSIAAWRKQLDAWVDSKMKEFDSDEAFRAQRLETHSSREEYEKFLRAKADAKIKKRLE